jgi:endo-alpha-1,4-polygalactosaminidase (GH114 family)
MKKYILLFTALILGTSLFSCSKDKDDETQQEQNQVNAIAVYNQAYQETFEPDTVTDIIVNATNAYVLVDPFEDNTYESVAAIKQGNNQVGAYISIGTGETYRDDFAQLEPYLVATPWGEWPDEYFVNEVTTGILPIMKARIDQIAAWGCDWVEFDNMDWVFDEASRATYGFQVTETEGIAYFQELCNYVHLKGMKCMAKNMTENAFDFDGVLYESYTDDKNWWDEAGAQSFLNAGKLVIVNHYGETNCGRVYSDYKGIYSNDLSFICEDINLQKYVHFNE